MKRSHDWMSDDQRACYSLLCDLLDGPHRVKAVYPFGLGLKTSVLSGVLSTYDGDLLTRLVVLAHDQHIRAEIIQSAPGRVGIVLHRRQRAGSLYERHPTMEEAVTAIRSGS